MKTKVTKITNTGLRVVIMLLTFVFVYKQVFVKHDAQQWHAIWQSIKLGKAAYFLLIIISVLLIFNILTESFKWKFLIAKLEKVKLNQAISAVLSGMAVSMFLPNRVGDYLGRVFVLQKASHVKGILATLIGSLSQIIATLIIGLFGLMFFLPKVITFDSQYYYWLYAGFWIAFVVFSFVVLLLYFQVGLLKMIVTALFSKMKQQIIDYAEVFSLYTVKDLIILLFYSVLRYIIYSTQFYLMLRVFGINTALPAAFMLISVIYLLMTLIPTITITELGIRGSVSAGVFGLYFEQTGVWNAEMAFQVIAASSALWLLNLVIPSLLGALLTFRLKFFRRNIDDV